MTRFSAAGSEEYEDVIDRAEILYLKMVYAEINYGDCAVKTLFYHMLLKKIVCMTRLLFICREKGNWHSSLIVFPVNNVKISDDVKEILRSEIEKTFGRFF